MEHKVEIICVLILIGEELESRHVNTFLKYDDDARSRM
jgi:hypothetical protein